MDPISIIAIAALIGYSIFKETPEEKAARERTKYERERAGIEFAEKQRKIREAWEAQERERKRPFKTARECFEKQYVSYTRISTYNSCPHRFKLIYLDKNKSQSQHDYYFRKGSVFHEAMKEYFRGYLGRVISGLDYGEIIDRVRWYLYEKTKEKRKVFRNNVKFLCKTFPNDVEIVAVEQELSFKVNDIKFYGIVDLVLKYPDGHLEIVDYKTGLRLPTKEQLEIYSIPFTKSSNYLPINFRVICVDRESHYVWKQNAQETIESANNILGIVNTITNDDSFTPAIGSHCENCSVREVCKYSEEYQTTGIKRRLPAKRYLTKLRSNYEWKPRRKLPKSMDADFGRNGRKKSGSKRKRGLSFSLSKAKKEYQCLKTNKTIHKDEYHFVDHRGKRYCMDAFTELYPERATQIIEERNKSISKKGSGLSFSLSKAKKEHRCSKTNRVIQKDEYHFVDHKGKRYCMDAFMELYPERANQLIEGKKSSF